MTLLPDSVGGAGLPVPGQARRRRPWLSLAGLLLAAGLAAYVLAGSREQLTQAADTLSRVRLHWVLVAVVAEVASYVFVGAGLRRLLGGGPGLATTTTIGVTAQAAANCLPGGAAVSGVVTYRQLRRRGAPTGGATAAVVVLSVLQAASLPLLTLVGEQLATGEEPIPGLRTLSAVLLGVLAALTVALVALRRHRLPSRALTWMVTEGQRVRRRLPGGRSRPAEAGPTALQSLQGVRLPPAALVAASVYALAYWLADALCLSAAFPAVGAAVPWGGLLVSYSAAQLASVLPFTPGGLGVVEGSLTVGLVAYGGSTTSALSAVLLYRLVSFWGLLPAGAVGWLFLARRRPAVPLPEPGTPPADLPAPAALPARSGGEP